MVTLLLILLVLPFTFSQQANKIVKLSPENCVNNQFFDISHIKCLDCPSNTQPTSDRMGCQCAKGMRRVKDYGGVSLQCEPCPDNKVPTPDGWGCVGCADGQNPLDNGQCKRCEEPGQFSYLRTAFGVLELQQKCRPCSGYTYPEPNSGGHFCVPCNPDTQGEHCQCLKGQKVGGICFETEQDKKLLLPESASLHQIEYENKVIIDSLYFKENLRAAYAMCARQNLTACQLLANLCVLLQYKQNRQGSGDNACNLYVRLASTGGQQIEWPNYMPWLYYINGEARTILGSLQLSTSYSFSSDSPNSKLALVATVYSLDGHYLETRNVTGGLLQLCKNVRAVIDAAYLFGRKYNQECSIKLQDFFEDNPMELLDLYLQYEEDTPDGGKEQRLWPVPVLNLNYQDDSGNLINREQANAKWQLTRRFFLVDNIAGKETSTGEGSRPKIVRYPKMMRLTVELQTTQNGHIFPPYLSIEYGELKVEDFKSNPDVSVTFQVQYELNRERRTRDLEITMGILCSLAVLWSGLRAWSWTRRTGKYMVDLTTVFKFLLYLCGSLADVFFAVMLGMSCWLLVTYKMQQTVVYMILTEEQEQFFIIYIIVAIVLKTVEMVHVRVEQMLTETFFIDWERPRGHVMPREGEPSDREPSVAADGQRPASPITIWRTYMVANEWNELQTYRKTSPAMQLFAMIFFLQVLNFEALALAQPGAHLESAPKEYADTRMNRFALAAGMYLLIGLLQWTVNVLVIERIFVDHFRNFMDLCSICNISVLALTRSQFGYYIHGRSVHGHADTNMREMNEMLQRERDNLCGQRGLEPGTEEQCFIVSLPNAFRDKFESVRDPIKSSVPDAGRLSGMDLVTARMENVIQVYENMNQFLAAFIEQRIPSMGYTIRNRSFLEALLDFELQDASQQGIFFRDFSEMAHSAAFLYGNEWTNLSFDLLVFCFVDMLAHNFMLAAVVTYLVIALFQNITEMGFTRNLMKSTLVDDRFLI